jgi:small GTP-binding protein domain
MAVASIERVALIGNPNCGKTALFNQLTGSRQKVANYAGVTVERKEGRYLGASGRVVQVLDLPGAYSLDATSPDEAVTRDVLRGVRGDAEAPDLIVCVVDATNLRLHLRFVLELLRLNRPMVLALNMIDAAERHGIRIDRDKLEQELGIPVVPTVAVRRGGVRALAERLEGPPPLASTRVQPPGADLHAEVNRSVARGRPATADQHHGRRLHRPHRPASRLGDCCCWRWCCSSCSRRSTPGHWCHRPRSPRA